MDNTATDYKKLYEQSLELLAEKEKQLTVERETISEKESQIISLNFELDKFRRYLFGSKSEKLPLRVGDTDQLSLFDLGTTGEQKEELSRQAAEKPAKKTILYNSRI